MPKRSTTLFRDLLYSQEILELPGVYDAFSAKIAEKAGFNAITMGGYQVSASLLGEPDVGYLTLTEMAFILKKICDAVKIPVLADADTGYGNFMNVRRMIKEYEDSGAAAIFIEDQEWPKRCGHMEGKKLISVEEHCMKIKAAVESRRDPDLVIMARTDARAVSGLEDAIYRATEYAKAGADMLFIEAPQSVEEMKYIVNSLKPLNKPLLANMIERGKTPILNSKELQEMGFAAVAFPVSAIYSAAKTFTAVYETIKKDGSTKNISDKMSTFKEFNSLIGLPHYLEIEQKYKL
jgi:methylisocitrate lyase